METKNNSDIEWFLKDIKSINLKYEKLNEASGSNFNLFSIIRKGTEEVELHSRFIGELLDPKGTHDQKDLFLRIFIDQLNIKNKGNKIIHGDFELSIEKSVGDYGRIDLLISSKDELIIIENKIYAQDQPKQLERYSNASKDYYPNNNLNLFYLTLLGDEPSQKSKGNLADSDFECISYAIDIKCWLDSCAKEVYDLPILRETITQYRRLIEGLTGQSINKEQKMEIQNLLLTDNNFEHALSIDAVLTDTKIAIQKLVWKELGNGLHNSGFDFSFVNSSFEPINIDTCDKFYAARDKSSLYGLQYEILKVGDYSIHLYIEIEGCLYFGLTVCKNNIKGDFNNEFKKSYPKFTEILIADRLETTDSARWIGWKYTTEQVNFRNFNDKNSAKIANTAFRHEFIEESIKDICSLINNCLANKELL